jgi:hypothetical protein
MAASSFHRALGGGEAARTKLVLLVLSSVVVALASSASAIDERNLTAGFVQVELTESNFKVQRPYDVPENQRYSYDNVTGVRTFLVYAGDKPFNTVTGTLPRTEVRLAVRKHPKQPCMGSLPSSPVSSPHIYIYIYIYVCVCVCVCLHAGP